MPEIVSCPSCKERTSVRGSKNPMQCKECNASFNLIIRSVPIRLEFDENGHKNANQFLAEYHIMGDYFSRSIWRRHNYLIKGSNWQIVPKPEGKIACSLCAYEFGAKAKSAVQMNGQYSCAKCSVDDIYGKRAKASIYPGKSASDFQDFKNKLGIEMPYKTYASQAWEQACSAHEKWIDDNWVVFLRRTPLLEELRLCKQRNVDFCDSTENNELCVIRDKWRAILAPMSPLWFFYLYYRARDINQRNRPKRRERIKQLGNKVTSTAYRIAKPICDNCEHLEQHDWGWECKLDSKLGNVRPYTGIPAEAKLSRLPKFTKSTVKIYAKSYHIDLETREAKINMMTKGQQQKARILGADFLRKRYGAKFFKDTSRYPTLFRGDDTLLHSRKTKHEQQFAPYMSDPYWSAWHYDEEEMPLHQSQAGKEELTPFGIYWIAWNSEGKPMIYEIPYYLLYPFSETAPFIPGDWYHIIAYGPIFTCILSILGDKQKVKFFNHGQLVSYKEYFTAQRKKMQKEQDALKKAAQKEDRKISLPRIRIKKESRKIKNNLHKETFKIAQYLLKMPGMALVLNMQKTKLGRGVDERRELNQKLAYWADSNFRMLIGYKLLRVGFIVEEQNFQVAVKKQHNNSDDDLSLEQIIENVPGLAKCPYCETEVGGSWQEIVVFSWQRSIFCSSCNKETNVMLAIALCFWNENKKKMIQKKERAVQ
ncbi:hypothetical protein CL633_02845 [bacterium]|nr:hypothetical protein [bacterium]|tara:strand:+ start:7971 stop:10088 length:2118 start_codon:yes stop_codon:yes gene_type:complete